MRTLLRKFLTLAVGRDGATVGALQYPLGYQQLSNTALQAAVGISLTAAQVIAARQSRSIGFAIIQAQAGTVRWRDDGVAPDANTGMTIASGAELDYRGDFTKILFITGSGTPIVDISLYA